MIIKLIKEYRKLKYIAYHDLLTGLLNRNWLHQNIDNISAKYVYYIDINNLHVINKKGHSIGDEYIKDCINTIKLDKTDILIRYGGDEFILLSNTRNKIITNDIFSVGMSIYDNNLIETIHHADTEMIHSKCKWKKSIR